MEPRLIKTDAQHRSYLAEVERLAKEDPAPSSADGDRLELLAKLVEDYEKSRFVFRKPGAVEAIRFRMGEQGLKQKDLAPILGGKSRVSEILSGKRPLTLQMVRALGASLAIPAEILVRDEAQSVDADGPEAESVASVPLLVKSGMFSPAEASRLTTSAIVARYLKPARGPLFLRRTITYGASAETNKPNLRLWVGRVREIAYESRAKRGEWQPGLLGEEFLHHVAQLSWASQGPRLAQEFLATKGIALVILPALPGTRLDGAAMKDQGGAPVIGLTVRHDRLDNFWFTLLHELAHAWKHLPANDVAITDEDVGEGDEDDAKESEANRIACEAFIPRAGWKRSEAFLRPSVQSIEALASRLHICPAVVAGRLRREKVGYRMVGNLVGNGLVRKHFPEVNWG